MAENSDIVKCPKCQSDKISGLMGAFYVPVDSDGEPVGQWTDYESSTELTGDYECSACNFQWDDTDGISEGEVAS